MQNMFWTFGIQDQKEQYQFYSSTFQVSDSPYDEEMVSNIPMVTYEFPSGYRNDYGVERFKIAETIFDPNRVKMPQAGSMLSAAHVVTTSVGESHTTTNLLVLFKLKEV